MQCNSTTLLVIIMGIVAPCSKVQGFFRSAGTIPKKCTLTPDYGKCKTFLTHFYYDVKSKMCREFIYSGCGGNGNNFLDLYQCVFECHPSALQVHRLIGWKQELPLKCKRPFTFGNCQSSVLRYYYNVKLKRCFMFIFSGCGSNENNFHSFRECYEECEKYEIPEYLINPDILKEFLLDYCDQPLDMGDCHSAFPRFYYDDRSRTCKPFNYTGCAGNRNNFNEEYECFWACAGNG
ncbi:carboxypeptidase inhibitor SmCI-like [Podarcis lilfordi]|uniref:Carboxypeptidase inhibitor SmCI-like n=1 Tax=Podarcis lilfordi TaxID=74358 RepID=A0AA35LFU0_9SAUR|nr:carboxypeptidase inhibitor SmCI-like [Podarcis lilfordi]